MSHTFVYIRFIQEMEVAKVKAELAHLPPVSVIFGPKAAKRYLLIKSGFFQDEVKKIGPPLFVDARLRENLF